MFLRWCCESVGVDDIGLSRLIEEGMSRGSRTSLDRAYRLWKKGGGGSGLGP